MNRSIHTIRILSIILAVLFVGLFVVICMNYQADSMIEGPQITMDTDTVTISIRDGDEAILQGVRATDSNGQDVSDLLIVESRGRFNPDGTLTVKIAAFDRKGNVSKSTRTVIYSDYTSPRLSLSGPLSCIASERQELMDRIQVIDCLDGDISANVTLTYTANGSLPDEGEFPLLLQVSNSAGDSLEMPLTVEYYSAAEERTRPEIGLTQYLIYAQPGTRIDPENYLLSLTLDNREYQYDLANHAFVLKGNTYQQAMNSVESNLVIPISRLQITAARNYNEPGVYEVTYRCTSAAGVIGTVRLVIIIEQSGG